MKTLSKEIRDLAARVESIYYEGPYSEVLIAIQFVGTDSACRNYLTPSLIPQSSLTEENFSQLLNEYSIKDDESAKAFLTLLEPTYKHWAHMEDELKAKQLSELRNLRVIFTKAKAHLDNKALTNIRALDKV